MSHLDGGPMEVSAPALVIKPWRAAPHAAPVGGLPVDNPLRVSAGGSHARLPHARLPVRRCMDSRGGRLCDLSWVDEPSIGCAGTGAGLARGDTRDGGGGGAGVWCAVRLMGSTHDY